MGKAYENNEILRLREEIASWMATNNHHIEQLMASQKQCATLRSDLCEALRLLGMSEAWPGTRDDIDRLFDRHEGIIDDTESESGLSTYHDDTEHEPPSLLPDHSIVREVASLREENAKLRAYIEAREPPPSEAEIRAWRENLRHAWDCEAECEDEGVWELSEDQIDAAIALMRRAAPKGS